MSARSIRRAQQRRLATASRRETVLRRRLGLAAGAAVGASALFAGTAQAATFVVNAPGDRAATNVCAEDCTLRDAITTANETAGDDVITFAEAIRGTIALTEGELLVSSGGERLTVEGPGAAALTVSGQDLSRVFFLQGTSGVRIAGLTIADGSAGGGSGGAIIAQGSELELVDSVVTGSSAATAGGVYAQQDLQLLRTTVAGNVATAGDGGGVVLLRTGTITASTISGNTSTQSGGGVAQRPSNKYGELRVRDSTVSGNTAQSGGGLSVERSKYTDIAGSTVSGNVVGDDGVGAGVALDSVLPLASFSVDRSTISGNTGGAGSIGGGIGLAGFDYVDRGGPGTGFVAGTFDVVNTTVSGNTAGTGGGIAFGSTERDVATIDNASISLANSTVVDNTGGGLFLNPAGAPEDDPEDSQSAPFLVTSTIVARNTAEDLTQSDPGSPGSGFDLSFALVQRPGATVFTESPAGSNLIGLDPELGALADNGGPTRTHAPTSTSPVVDRGDAPAQVTTDQRGLPRTDDTGGPRAAGGDGTDVGAVELDLPTRQVVAPAPTTPPAPDDPRPTVTFTAPAANARLSSSKTTTLTAAATDDKGVVRVQFVDGGRVVCTDTTAPYTCAFRPTSADVGRKDFEVVATDTAGQTASASRSFTVTRFSLGRLTIAVTPESDRRSPFTFTTSGRLVLPARVTRAAGCSGLVSVVVKAGGNTISTRRVKVSRSCTYASRVSFTIPRRLLDGRLTIRATYGGSEVLNPRRSALKRVTAG